MGRRADPQSHLPLSPLDFAVLVALRGGASYGYQIVKSIAAAPGGGIRLAPGNLYQVLDRLLVRGWIRALPASALPAGADERRRYYGLTAAGVAVAAAESARLQALLPTLQGLDLLPGRPR